MLMVYEYGLIQPTDGEKLVDEQIYLAHQYYNKLVELEQERRYCVLDAQLQFPHIEKAQQEYEKANNLVNALMKQKKQAKSYDQKIQAPPPEQIKQAKEARKTASEKAKAAKVEEKEKLKPIYKKLEEKFHEKKLEARSKSGLYWGNKQVIDDAFDAAKKATLSLAKLNQKKKGKKYSLDDWINMPRFRKWTGQGAVMVQIHNGMCLEDLWGSNTQLKIDPLPENAFDKSVPRAKRNKLQRTHVHLRVCSENRKPVWAIWPLFMHRELPEGAVIKKAKVIRIPWNQRWEYKWKLQLTLELPEPRQKAGRSMVAVNVGWRKMEDDELRVATWVDTHGNTGEVRLDASFRQRIEKAEKIRGYRDKNLDKLRDYLMEQKLEGIDCSKWKSHKRFHRLIKEQGEKFPPNVMQTLNEWYERPTKTGTVMESWIDRDNHLWWYERGCRTGALNYRREIYRIFALDIAKRYDIVVVENYNLTDIVTDPDRIQEPSAQRVEGSPSEARNILRSTANRLGCLVIDGDSKLATQRCHICDHEEPWNAASKVMHTCAGCDAEWDQDVNNARNMLKSAQPMIADALLKKNKKNKKYVGRFHKHKEKFKEPPPVV